MFTSVSCTVVGTGNRVSSKTKSPIQWEEKDNKQTNEYSVCQRVIDATEKTMSRKGDGDPWEKRVIRRGFSIK